MKKLITFSFVALSALMVFGAWMYSDNGKAGNTGSPAEQTCIQCHSTYPVNSGGGGINASSTMTNWEYVPGQTYTINVTVNRATMDLFGFGAELLTSANDNAGTMIVTNPNKTQIKTKTVSGVSRNNMVHTLGGGGNSPDSCVFSFNWTAPATNVGNVTMYFAGVACDDDGSSDNDYVYNGSQVITPSTQGINENNTFSDVQVYMNNSTMNLTLNYHLNQAGNVVVRLLALNGQLIDNMINEKQMAGNVQRNLSLPASVKAGTYLVELINENSHIVKKIVVL